MIYTYQNVLETEIKFVFPLFSTEHMSIIIKAYIDILIKMILGTGCQLFIKTDLCDI